MQYKNLLLGIIIPIMIGGCANNPPEATFSPLSVAKETGAAASRAMETGDLKPGGLGYIQTESNSVNVPSMGVIVYRNKDAEAAGKEIEVLAAGVSPHIMQRVLPAAINAGGFIAGNAVYGLSRDAAKTIVASIANAEGGDGGNASARGGSSSSSSTANPQVSNDTDVNNTNTNDNDVTCSGIGAGDDVDVGSGADSC